MSKVTEPKVCFIFHGHMRTFEKTIESLKQNINNFNNIDIFIHTWDTIDRLTPSYYIKNQVSCNKINSNIIEDIYKPKGLLIEKQVINNPHITCPNNKISLEGHKYYFESFYKANELKKKYENENNFKYDIVIKSRPDVIFKTPLDLTKLNMKKTYLLGNPINNNINNNITLNNLLNFRAFNVITICNSKNMDKIADFYHSMDKYIFIKLCKHSDFVHYILDLNLDLEILNYFYNRNWGFLRL